MKCKGLDLISIVVSGAIFRQSFFQAILFKSLGALLFLLSCMSTQATAAEAHQAAFQNPQMVDFI